MLDQLEVYHDPEPRDAALNMAVDEALLETVTSPALRLYRWRKPTISIGYFGLFAEVANRRAKRELVRRWTGGGVVQHGEDFTYSVIIPAAHPSFAFTSLEIYSHLHEAIRKALLLNGVEAALASDASPKVSEDCFSNAVRADVLRNGRKIAGAAHRRSRAGLLHQGSIQLPDLPHTFAGDLAATLCQRFQETPLPEGLIDRAQTISAAKYARADWLMRR